MNPKLDFGAPETAGQFLTAGKLEDIKSLMKLQKQLNEGSSQVESVASILPSAQAALTPFKSLKYPQIKVELDGLQKSWEQFEKLG